jgi:glyoxylase-like metal-dependent hydrolase (beta-lactamase superfamily II)
MGVGMTLLAGSERALLFDAGYGLWDLNAFLSTLCDKPLTILMSHIHHDHLLGAKRLMGKTQIHAADLRLQNIYTTADRRRLVLAAAREWGLLPDAWAVEHYLKAPMPEIMPLQTELFELGGLSARVLHLPGHTPGSIGLMVEERGLLLLGDSWNPQTWVFFPECCPISRYRQSMRSLIGLSFGQVLVSHYPMPRRAADLRAYIDGMTDEALDRSLPCTVTGYEDICTYRCDHSPTSPLIFDRGKWRES